MRSRLRVAGSIALGVLLLAGGRARAQPAAAPVGEAPAPLAAPPATSSPAVDGSRDDESWSAYHEAFAALVRGDRLRARQLLDAIVLLHPTHPAAALARSLAANHGASPPPAGASPARGAPPPRNGTTNAARAELIVFQTLHGVVAGFELCQAVECSGVRPHALSLMGTGGLGLGLSIGLSRGGVRPGDTAAIDAGTFWGFWNGLALAAANDASAPHVAQALLYGQGLGLGAGLLVARVARPTAGQVSLASTFATWSTTLTLLALIAGGDGNQSAKDIWVPLALASDVGLLVGGVVGRGSTISRGRTALIDAGGALGLLLGGLAASGADRAQPIGVSMMAGTGIGLVCATLATASWDAPGTGATPPVPPGLPSTVNLVPTPEPGGGAGMAFGGTF